jgi:hypothetical protein
MFHNHTLQTSIKIFGRLHDFETIIIFMDIKVDKKFIHKYTYTLYDSTNCKKLIQVGMGFCFLCFSHFKSFSFSIF